MLPKFVWKTGNVQSTGAFDSAALLFQPSIPAFGSEALVRGIDHRKNSKCRREVSHLKQPFHPSVSVTSFDFSRCLLLNDVDCMNLVTK